MKYLPGKKIFTGLVLFLLAVNAFAADEKYLGVPLAEGGLQTSNTADHYGVPFLQGVLPLKSGGSAQVNVEGTVKRIFLLGMTDASKATAGIGNSLPGVDSRRALAIYGWADPRETAVRIMIGDDVGKILLKYDDGTTQVFPLILGESIWWGQAFYGYQDPFAADAALRKAFAQDLRLYPPMPVKDGNYVAVIKPRAVPLQSITVENSQEKAGTVVIAGITIESADTNGIAGTIALGPGIFSPDFAKFAEEKPLRFLGEDEKEVQRQLENLKQALYSSDESFRGPVAPERPRGYTGPIVSFQGNISANILANAFYYNVEDILAKIDEKGMYHTSTKGAISWGSYRGFGTFRTNVGSYYGVSYTRDMGRSLQEITMLGYTNDAARCAAYDLKMARRYSTEPFLKYKEVFLPPHWGDLANNPRNPSFENDGQGLTTMFLYKLWQRLPDREEWLHAHWPDVKAAGDWILWELAHPEISGATNGVLHTTGESGNGDGYAAYPDSACMNSLRALAQMADSIGETNSAAQWRACADKMQIAIGNQYIIQDPQYGPDWTLDYANWAYDGSVLGPLIFLADYQGFAPQDENDDRRPVRRSRLSTVN